MQRPLLSLVFFMLALGCLAQSSADKKNLFGGSPVAELAASLTANCKTENDKVRSIFNWITENISYNTRIFAPNRRGQTEIWQEPVDTSATLQPLVEHVAEIVLSRRMAVCDGYTKLFKSLCDHASIRNEIITGYARTGFSSGKFKSNHSWNAVYTDSSWHLLDVTWASGYIYGNNFIRSYDSYYFFTSPQSFIRDHYPEDPQWTLLNDQITPREFNQSPFRCTEFVCQRLISYFPAKGVIEASTGDTLKFQLSSEILNFTMGVSSSPLADSTQMKPVSAINGKASYDYIVPAGNLPWLYIYCNDEIVLRYKLNYKKTKSENKD